MLTVITRLTLKDGAEEEWDRTMSDRMRAAEGQDGWIGGQLLKPRAEPATRVIVGTWDSRENWEDWHGEEAFRETRERLEGLQAGPADVAWHEAVLDPRGGGAARRGGAGPRGGAARSSSRAARAGSAPPWRRRSPAPATASRSTTAPAPTRRSR